MNGTRGTPQGTNKEFFNFQPKGQGINHLNKKETFRSNDAAAANQRQE